MGNKFLEELENTINNVDLIQQMYTDSGSHEAVDKTLLEMKGSFQSLKDEFIKEMEEKDRVVNANLSLIASNRNLFKQVGLQKDETVEKENTVSKLTRFFN